MSNLRGYLATPRSRQIALAATLTGGALTWWYIQLLGQYQPTVVSRESTRLEEVRRLTERVTPPSPVGPVTKAREDEWATKRHAMRDGRESTQPMEVFMPSVVTRDSKVRPDATDTMPTVASSALKTPAPSKVAPHPDESDSEGGQKSKAKEAYADVLRPRFIEAHDSSK